MICSHIKVPGFVNLVCVAAEKPTLVGCFGSRKRAAASLSRLRTKVLHPSGFFLVPHSERHQGPKPGRAGQNGTDPVIGRGIRLGGIKHAPVGRVTLRGGAIKRDCTWQAQLLFFLTGGRGVHGRGWWDYQSTGGALLSAFCLSVLKCSVRCRT